MNLELSVRLIDSNFEFENIMKTDTLSSSESHSDFSNNESIYKKGFLNKLFFSGQLKQWIFKIKKI